MLDQNVILTLTSFNGLLGSDKKDLQIHNGIFTLTSLNGTLGKGKKKNPNLYFFQKGEGGRPQRLHFQKVYTQ